MALVRIFQAGCDVPDCYETIVVYRTGLEPALDYLVEKGWYVSPNHMFDKYEVQCPVCRNLTKVGQ